MMKVNSLKLKKYDSFLIEGQCLVCKTKIAFYEDDEPIKVNCHSIGFPKIKLKRQWLSLNKPCNNPICEWSKIK